MKIGYEVEGAYKGLRTLFMDAVELHDLGPGYVAALYISDLQNSLRVEDLRSKLVSYPLVTLEVTAPPVDLDDTPNLVIMLNGPTFDKVSVLRPWDQVKINNGQNVVVFPMSSAIFTKPSDFSHDKEC